MNNESAKSQADGSNALFDALKATNLIWQTYFTTSQALLFNQQNTAAFMAMNRSLMAETQAIFRQSRDLATRISERAMERASSPSRTMISATELDEIYDSAVSGVREVGDATLSAQLRSIEALREYARTMLKAASEPALTHPKD